MKKVFSIVVLGVAACLAHVTSFAADYKIDPVHSFVLFKVKHMGASYVYGQFTAMEGTIVFDAENPEASSVEMTIKSESVTTHNAGRDRHISGPDFFNVKEFPVMTFKSSSWKKAGENTYAVTGDFTLLGVTKTVTATVEHVGDGTMRGKEIAGFHTVFTIDRSEFGMKYGIAPGGGGLGKDIEITISVESIKQ